MLSWALGDLWTTAGDGNQGGVEVSGSDNRGRASRDSGDGSGNDSDGGELHYNERLVVGEIG